MAKAKKEAATVVAALQKVYEEAAKKVADLSDEETPEVRQALAEEVAAALENLNNAKKEVLVKFKFIKSPTGRFGLGYNAGDSGYISLLLADVAQEEGYGFIQEGKDVADIEVTE
jgi:hydrogenase maturation factor HypE